MTNPELLAAVIANKSDDVPRLIYADWLDEHGESERAEFIRVQCKLAKFDGSLWSVESDDLRGSIRDIFVKNGERMALREFIRPCGIEVGGERRWLSATAVRDIRRLPASAGRSVDRTGTEIMSWEWTRGFISTITCSWQDWLTHADSILKATPLERVRLTTGPDTALYEPFQQQWPGIEFELPQPRMRRATVAGREVWMGYPQDIEEVLFSSHLQDPINWDYQPDNPLVRAQQKTPPE